MSVNELLEKVKKLHGCEGIIIRFADGHMLKIKAEEYVRIHKTIDRVRFDRHIVELILEEELDDAVALLPAVDAARVHAFAQRFADRLHYLCESYERYYNTVVASGLDRKRYAQEWMPTIKGNDPFAPAYVFGRFGGRNGREMILDHIKKHLSTNVRWDECAHWMGM